MSRISIYGGRKTYRFVNKAKSALITDLCRIQETFPAGSGIKRLLLCTPNPGVWGDKPSGRNNKKKGKVAYLPSLVAHQKMQHPDATGVVGKL